MMSGYYDVKKIEVFMDGTEWCAQIEGTYPPENAQGFGGSAKEAVEELLEKLDDGLDQ